MSLSVSMLLKNLIKKIPKDKRNLKISGLSTEEILVRSSNVGSVILAQKIGEDVFKKFIKKTNLTKVPVIELEEVGVPHKIKWNKCKIETVSFGHGITTTPLQATTLYASLTNGGNLVTPCLLYTSPSPRD